MNRKSGLYFCAAILSTVAFQTAVSRATLIWDESLFGDLSGDRLNPNHFVLSQGANTIIATSSTNDKEYIRLTIPAGSIFSAINHVSWSGIDQTGFIGVQNGTTFTEPPSGTNVANLLGYTHFGPGQGTVGQNIMPLLAIGPGSQGFTPPLSSGEYTFWLNQTSPNFETYRLDFMVTPEPATAACLLLIGFIAFRRHRR